MAFPPTTTLLDEITDFLVSNPTTAQIIEYQPSEQLNNRLHELLDKNSEAHLTTDERSELDAFLQIGHLLTMLKAKARIKDLDHS